MKLRRPFEKLMEMLEGLCDLEEPMNLTLADLSKRWDETPERIMDAIDAVRVKNGERTYITVDVAPEEKQ